MTLTGMIELVKENLKIMDSGRDLLMSDLIREVMEYCNLTELPAELEPFIRRKIKTVIDYEAEFGNKAVFDVKAVKEGDTQVTYADETSLKHIYGLSAGDKQLLSRYRRLRR